MPNPKTYSDMIGASHVTRLDTLRMLCEYIVSLRAEIATLRGDMGKVQRTVAVYLGDDHEEAKQEQKIVAELLGGESTKIVK